MESLSRDALLLFIDARSVALCVTRVRQKQRSNLIARISIVQADRRPYSARIIRACVCAYVYGNLGCYSGKSHRPHVGFAAEKRVVHLSLSLFASMNPARRHVINGHQHRITRSVGRAHPTSNTFRSIYRRRRRIIIVSSVSRMLPRGTFGELSIQCQSTRRR